MAARQGGILNLKAGDWVEVRCEEEILATLDAYARLENLPFMPEMLQYCGQRLRVAKRADKTCDPGHTPWTIRRMKNAVHLDGVRCCGDGHGGCQAGCLIWWKEAWLKRSPGTPLVLELLPTVRPVETKGERLCTIDAVCAASQSIDTEGEVIYSCQATDVRKFTSEMSWWDPRQYVRDWHSGNLRNGLAHNSKSERVLEFVLAVLLAVRLFLISFFTERRLLNYPSVDGSTPRGSAGNLALQPGELVRVRSKGEIMTTLDKHRRNRGLLFDGEMLRYCGGIFTVLRQINRIIDERTGKMIRMKYPSVILQGGVCRGDYHRMCPRAIYHYWRESWLVRVNDNSVSPSGDECNQACEQV